MKVEVDFKFGEVVYKLWVEDRDEMDTLHKSIVLSNPPHYCHVCGNTNNFKLDTNKDQEGNTYVNVVCLAKDCYAKAKLGRYKTGGYFWHKFEKYTKPGTASVAQPTVAAPSVESVEADDIPF